MGVQSRKERAVLHVSWPTDSQESDGVQVSLLVSFQKSCQFALNKSKIQSRYKFNSPAAKEAVPLANLFVKPPFLKARLKNLPPLLFRRRGVGRGGRFLTSSFLFLLIFRHAQKALLLTLAILWSHWCQSEPGGGVSHACMVRLIASRARLEAAPARKGSVKDSLIRRLRGPARRARRLRRAAARCPARRACRASARR